MPLDVRVEQFSDGGGLEDVKAAFDAEHTRLFTFALEAEHELVNLRAVMQGRPTTVSAEEIPAGSDDASGAKSGTTTVWMDGAEQEAALYDRSRLQAGNRLAGPAIVTEMDSTTLILSGHSAEVDQFGNLIIRPQEG